MLYMVINIFLHFLFFHNKLHITKFFGFLAQNLPLQYYIYFLIPVFLWWHALSSVQIWMQTCIELKSSKQLLRVIVEIISYTLGSIFMVSCV